MSKLTARVPATVGIRIGPANEQESVVGNSAFSTRRRPELRTDSPDEVGAWQPISCSLLP
jgi:hypothetical protein